MKYYRDKFARDKEILFVLKSLRLRKRKYKYHKGIEALKRYIR